MRKDSLCSSLSTSRAPSATSYVSSTALSHNLENGDTCSTHEAAKVNAYICLVLFYYNLQIRWTLFR